MSRVAALTGGTGFLGRHTIRALANAGWSIRVLTRSAPDLPDLADIEIGLVPGDLGDEAALRRLCEGADVIIHIAGLVKAPNREAFFRANAEGAAKAATAWREAAPDARFTLISSMAAREPALSHYAASKREGEERVKRIAQSGDFRVLRPGAIYGAHDEETLKVLKLASGPVQIMLNDPAARVAMIDVRDAARAIQALVDHPGDGAVIELSDAQIEGYRWDDLAATASRALGRTPRAIRIPADILRFVGAAGETLAGITGSAEMLTRGKVREILHPDWGSQAERQISPDIWRPEISLETGLEDMARWARDAGRL